MPTSTIGAGALSRLLSISMIIAIIKESGFAFKRWSICIAPRRFIPRRRLRLITGRICPKGSSAGNVFTHGSIFGFFAQQGRYAAPIKVKFGKQEPTVGPLLRAKFHLDRSRGGGLRPPKLKKNRILPI